ncbi:hypothetical protein [Pseudomonas sp. COW5]|uniref:hypothetical protein n=1 Tax=Pseudomonas sp. COW5 TaxID=2981253 RepID=UPI0022470D0E|nr:hypothetical protein [Pseudomonas sp. COW5]MCX2546485.1 hypothetical protein [Pseudomonas sp. COW5]
MATTGSFTFETNKHGNFRANKLALSEVGKVIKVDVSDVIGPKGYSTLTMEFERFKGTKTFKDELLPTIRFHVLTDSYNFFYTEKSGSLTVTIEEEEVLKIHGMFNLEMAASPDSDPAGPKQIDLTNGVFNMKN